MMFVKHCPDPALLAIFRLKAPDKWTASELQEHLDRYQTEQKEQLAVKSKRNFNVRNASAHTRSPMEGEVTTSVFPVVSSENVNASTPSHLQNDDNCMKMLIGLLGRALTQNVQAELRLPWLSQPLMRPCKVCHSPEQSTLTHC